MAAASFQITVRDIPEVKALIDDYDRIRRLASMYVLSGRAEDRGKLQAELREFCERYEPVDEATA